MLTIENIFDQETNGYKWLLQSKYIKLFENKVNLSPLELEILNHRGLKETIIQQKCHELIKYKARTLPAKCKLKFIAVDNGGKMGIGQRIKKAKEGTVAGMTDSLIFASNGTDAKVWAVEFKRVGSKSEILGDKKHFQDQLDIINEFNDMGISAYMTNNIIFFENVIFKEIEDFLNKK